MDSTNIHGPAFGPTWPLYPPLAQLVRVTGAALAGTNPAVYPCLVAQLDPATLTVRAREAAYVVEPNNVALGLSYYDCRLVGAYQGPTDLNPIPLYATTCCVTSVPTSASSAGPSCTFTRVALGKQQNATVGQLIAGGVALPDRCLLIVVVTAINGGATTCSWGTSALSNDVQTNPSGHGEIVVTIFTLPVTVGGVKNVKAQTVPFGDSTLMGVQMSYVQGVTTGLLDRAATASGTASVPSTGTYSPMSVPCEFGEAAVAIYDGFGTTVPVWDNLPFKSGGQDLLFPAAGAVVTEGYATLTSVQAAKLTNVISAWGAMLGTYP